MNDEDLYICEILEKDDRYPSTAYYFIRDALAFAADSMELNECSQDESSADIESELFGWTKERHLTGQQLCAQSVWLHGQSRIELMGSR